MGYNADPEKDQLSSSASPPSIVDKRSLTDVSRRGVFGRFADSFKPAEITFDTTGMTEAEIASKTFELRTKKARLSKRHAVVASMAGCVGTGLFIGSGNGLKAGGPAGLILGFGIMAIVVVCFIFALGEVTVRYKAPAFTNFVTTFIDPSWGFATSWAYAACWLVMMPLELIAAAMVIGYWDTDSNPAARVNPVAWVSLFYALIVFLSLFGVRGYGEVEFVLSSIKVVATVAFIIFSIVVTAGGSPSGKYFGGHYFHDPGAFANGFKGVVIAFINSAFAYGGTEVVGLAAARTPNPHRTFPSAIKQIFWRISIFFFVSIIVIGCLVPYTHPSLGTASNGSASPFVIAIKSSGVRALPSVFNAVIMLSVLSVANAAAFAGPQILISLAHEGHAPKLLGYIDRNGRPLVALLVTLIMGWLCFLAGYKKYGNVFNWLYAFVSLSFLFLWFSICVIHIRHRLAMRAREIPLDTLLYKSPLGIFGSVVGAGLIVLIIAFQFWTGLYPLGATKASAEAFFQNWLSVPFTLVLFVGHKLITRSKFVTNADLPIESSLVQHDLELVHEENKRHEEKKRASLLYRIESFWC